MPIYIIHYLPVRNEATYELCQDSDQSMLDSHVPVDHRDDVAVRTGHGVSLVPQHLVGDGEEGPHRPQ